MPKKTSNTSKQTSLFDIRLKNHDHDVLVLKGTPQDAASALLTGKIALSVNEPFTIKKLSLRLYATLRLDWNETVNATKPYERNIHHERKIYEYHWDNMEISKYLNHMYENSTSSSNLVGGSLDSGTSISLSRNGSTSSLKNLGNLRSKSSQNLASNSRISPTGSSSNLSGTSTNSKVGTHTLVQGNYEFPFSAILPGDIPESVEGLPGASVVYKLEATIDRGKFHNPMIAKKHLRVVRTLSTDSIELSESVAVDNTWPKKVEYSLTVPSKAVAVGSSVPITLSLVPLLKGLRLGETKMTLCEYYSYIGYVPPVHNGERVIVHKVVPAPNEDDPQFQMDKWQVDTVLKLPASLSKCTQDCDVLNNVKVRHKIKFAIGLVNPDGHVSELRASLPISLFISPFVTVRAIADVDNHQLNDIHRPETPAQDEPEEEIFTTDISQSHTNLTTLASSNTSNNSSYTSFSGIVAPPLYEQHIYDRLWSDVSPLESPLDSGTSTPRGFYHSAPGSAPASAPATTGVHDFNMSPIDTAQLSENLRLLSLQRASENSTPKERATFSLEGENNSDYFNNRRPNLSNRNTTYNFTGLTSPGVVSPTMHLSRTQSESILNSSEMFQVPSYTQAMKSDISEDALAPVYLPPLPGSKINLQEVNKNYEVIRAKTPVSGGSSSSNLRNIQRASNNSSPSSSNDTSSTNLSGLNMLSVSPPASTSVAKLSSSASDRTAAIGNPLPIRSNSSLSLHNLHFLNKKKEKKT